MPVLLLELGAEDGRGRATPQLHQFQQHRPELGIERAVAFYDGPFTDLSLKTSLALVLLDMWNLLVHSAAWQPERNGGGRGCI